MKLLAPIVALTLSVACTGLEPYQPDSGSPADSGRPDSPDSANSDTEGDADTDTDTGPPPVDADSDGHTNDVDCDDTNPDVYPGSEVRVDGRDSDCNGRTEWKITLYLAIDDIGSACIDNEANLVLPDGGNWQQSRSTEFWLESGSHTLGLNGRDTGYVITAAIAHLEGAGQLVVTDASWKYDPNPTFQQSTRSGWCSPAFDDSSWLNVKVIGPAFTTPPWTNAPIGFPATTPSSWVWDHYPVQLNTQYLRRTFTLP